MQSLSTVHRSGAVTALPARTLLPNAGTLRQRHTVCHRFLGVSAASSSGEAGLPEQQQPPSGFLQRVKRFFIGDGLDKERLKALGMGAFASYGFISNLNYGTALGISWLAFVKKYGVAPTAPGQWGTFLAFYAGLWAVQNFARPLRISLALALAPAFDAAITRLGAALRVDKRWAFGIFLLCMGLLTSATLFGTIWALGGFPPNPAGIAT